MYKNLVDEYFGVLKEKEGKNDGFPDTDEMKIAIFGQIAFKYEQECQHIYKIIKDKIVKDTTEEVQQLLD